jgi:hypothetical protein
MNTPGPLGLNLPAHRRVAEQGQRMDIPQATDMLALIDYAERLEKVARIPISNPSPTPTPGPWHRDPEMPTMILDAPLAQAKEIIAQTSGLANARLIAAAPDLLDIVKDDYQSGAFACLDTELCGQCRYCKRRALIERIDPEWLSKAEGRDA